jgi:hypothetical protein
VVEHVGLGRVDEPAELEAGEQKERDEPCVLDGGVLEAAKPGAGFPSFGKGLFAVAVSLCL